MDPVTPETEAGRALHISHAAYVAPDNAFRIEVWRKDILAIERQAATLALADVAGKVRGLPGFPVNADDGPEVVFRAAVLALLEPSCPVCERLGVLCGKHLALLEESR
jgi:hypothetical protein